MEQKNKVLAVGFIKTRKSENVMKDMGYMKLYMQKTSI